MTFTWSIEDIARELRYELTQARKIVAQSDFPRPIRIWDGASRRWVREEVMAWGDARKAAGRELLEEGSRFTALYRHFNKEGRLLYVGVSLTAIKRLVEHRNGCAWYRQIARIEVEWFDTRDEALAAEAEAIRTEKPRHNSQSGQKASSASVDPICRR
jgi:predicted DNA-binding transcriptional regulator AlpA